MGQLLTYTSSFENIAQMVPSYRSVGTAQSGGLVPLVSVGWYRYQMSATHAVKGRHVGSATRHPELA